MNFTRNAILSAIIFQMVNSTFPLQLNEARASEASKPSESQTKIPSANEFIKGVIAQRRDLVKAGCIKVDGTAVYRVIIDQADISKDDAKAASCTQAIMNFIAAEKEADEMMKQQEATNANCSNCEVLDPPIENVKDLQGYFEGKLNATKSCSDQEKAIISKEAKTCSLGCGINNALVASVNTQKDVVLGVMGLPLLAGLLVTESGRKTAKNIAKATDLKQNTGPNCPIAQGSALDCMGEIVKTFLYSMGQMITGIWNGVGAMADSAAGWASGLFGLHKKAESVSTQAMHPKAKMTDAEIKEMNEDKGAGFLKKIKDGLVTLFNFLVVDTKEIGAEFQCYHCKDRLTPLCKVIGLLGRDAVIAYLGGKAIDAMLPLMKRVAIKLGKGAASAGRSAFIATEKAAAKRAITRKLFQKGLNLAGRVSDKVAADYAVLKASAPIRFTKNTFKKGVQMPSKVIMAAKKTTNNLVDRIVEHDNLFSRVLKKAKNPSSEVMQASETALADAQEVVVAAAASGQADAIAQAEARIAKMRAKTTRTGKTQLGQFREKAPESVFSRDLHNLDGAIEVPMEIEQGPLTEAAKSKGGRLKRKFVSEQRSTVIIRDEAGEVIHRVEIPTGKTVTKVSTFDPKLGDGKVYPILEFKDGSTLIRSSQGEIRVPVESQHVVKEAMGLQIGGTDTKVLLDQEIKANMDSAGIKYHEESIGSSASGEKELKVEPQGSCQGEMGLVNAGRAL